MATKQKRKELTLEERYNLIKESAKSPIMKVPDLATKYGCGKTQVYSILQNKASIIQAYESNAPLNMKRNRKAPFSEINDLLYDWYLLAVSKNIYPDGPTLSEQAKKIAERLGIENFKASNGWLQKWKSLHSIKGKVISGESGEVSTDTVKAWKERLPEILEGYSLQNIFNMDETGCFWKALPEKGLAQKGKMCKGGKKPKHRLTIAFFVNSLGVKEFKPVVIWKSENPRCFKGVDKSKLPVLYYHQKKAWMTGDIMHTVLQKLNNAMKKESRSIILFIDGAGCHPPDLSEPGKFSNIKIIFLPPNTTSVLQPLDLGIIKNFKVHYRKLLLQHVIANIEECSTAHDVVKSVTVLTAIRWVAQGWDKVESSTIQKCFRHAGILDSDFAVVRRNSVESDPFADLDTESVSSVSSELQSLIRLVRCEGECSVEEFIHADDDIPTCMDLGDDWQDVFLSEITGPATKQTDVEVIDGNAENDDGDEEDDYDNEASQPKLETFGEAIECLQQVTLFLDAKGCTIEATTANQLLDTVKSLSVVKSTKQTQITSYF